VTVAVPAEATAAELEPERSLVLRSDDGNWVWAFSLVPEGAGVRLISRNRIATPSARLPGRLFYTGVEEQRNSH
jgi:hypothetical protein